jgi:hypothetical protein
MTRVSASFDPMPVLRQAKKDRVNAAFNDVAARSAHVEQAHAQKREWASARDPRLRAEADLRGMTLDEFAALILTKPDELAEREARRVAIMVKIDKATTPAELEVISA